MNALGTQCLDRNTVKQYSLEMAHAQASLLKSVAIQKFQSFQIRLPTVVPAKSTVSSGVMGSSSYTPVTGRSFGRGGHVITPPSSTIGTPMGCPPALFVAASNDKRDCDNQRAMSEKFELHVRKVSEMIGSAWADWQSTAVLLGVVINGQMASGGVVRGVGMSDQLRIAMASSMAVEFSNSDTWTTNRANALRRGLGAAFDNWASSLRVPNLAWYPSFERIIGPQAPPTPNTPTGLTTLTSSTESLRPQQLGPAISNAFGTPHDFSDRLFAALAEGIWAMFENWRQATLVRNVIGTGPVPNSLQGNVVVPGRVVAGTGNMLPGGFQ